MTRAEHAVLTSVANEPGGRYYPTRETAATAEALVGQGLLIVKLPECSYRLSDEGRALVPWAPMTPGQLMDALQREYGG